MYIKDLGYSFGVFIKNKLLQEFLTRDEAERFMKGDDNGEREE